MRGYETKESTTLGDRVRKEKIVRFNDDKPTLGAFGGLDVRVSPDRPKLKLSPDVPLRDDFRAEMDAWLLARFGMTNLLADGEVLRAAEPRTFGFGDRQYLLMNPRTFDQLKRVAKSSITSASPPAASPDPA